MDDPNYPLSASQIVVSCPRPCPTPVARSLRTGWLILVPLLVAPFCDLASHLHAISPSQGPRDPRSHIIPDCFPSSGRIGDEQPDADKDSISDECEYQVARTFAPVLRFRRDDRNSERDTYWEVRRTSEQLDTRCESYNETRETRGVQLWVFYALGYHRDGGRIGATWHHGDSEYVIVSVVQVGGQRWRLAGVCMSHHGKRAHYWADGETLVYDNAGRLAISVSYRKNANYVNRHCRHGNLPQPVTDLRSLGKRALHSLIYVVTLRFLWGDLCAVFPKEEDVEVLREGKLGPYNVRTGWCARAPSRDPDWCITDNSRITGFWKNRTGLERLWSPQRFCGWYWNRQVPNCAPSYLGSLELFGFTADPVPMVSDTSEAVPQSEVGKGLFSDVERATIERAIHRFAFGRAIVPVESEDDLREKAALLVGKPGIRITIEGHADSIGDAQYNHQLGMQRARAVRGLVGRSRTK